MIYVFLEEVSDEAGALVRIIAEAPQDLIGETSVDTKMGKMQVPAYQYNGEVIWGATAMMTAEFIALLS